MSTIAEAEKIVFSLSAKDRAALAGKMIRSLPSPGRDDADDDGVDEALRRSREMDENPAMSLTEEEFFASFEKYRR